MQWKLVLNILCDLYKVLVGYFDPNRFPLILGLSVDCGVVDLVPVVLCTLRDASRVKIGDGVSVIRCALIRLCIAYHHCYKKSRGRGDPPEFHAAKCDLI